MAATGSVRIWKTFTYRDNPKVWSNRYHFNGPAPTTQAYFNTMAANIAAAEAHIFGPNTTIIKADLLPPGSDVPTYTDTLSVVGTLDGTGAVGRCPGDAALVLRFATAARSSKNHPIYLFNYFHDVYQDSEGAPDEPLAAQVTAALNYGTSWVDGFTWGGGIGTIVRAGPNGVTAGTPTVLEFIGHRDFPR